MGNYTDFAGGVVEAQSGDIIQVKEVEFVTPSHISRSNATTYMINEAAIVITPQYSDSKIFGEIYFPMSRGYGSCLELYRAGAGVTDGALFSVTANYSTNYYFGLGYFSTGGGQWSPINFAYIDTSHNTTQEITYTPRVRAWTTYSTTGYYAHQNSQVLHRVYEIKV
jgi:hypothetical protein